MPKNFAPPVEMPIAKQATSINALLSLKGHRPGEVQDVVLVVVYGSFSRGFIRVRTSVFSPVSSVFFRFSYWILVGFLGFSYLLRAFSGWFLPTHLHRAQLQLEAHVGCEELCYRTVPENVEGILAEELF